MYNTCLFGFVVLFLAHALAGNHAHVLQDPADKLLDEVSMSRFVNDLVVRSLWNAAVDDFKVQVAFVASCFTDRFACPLFLGRQSLSVPGVRLQRQGQLKTMQAAAVDTTSMDGVENHALTLSVRLNKCLLGLSRRSADTAIKERRVTINDEIASLGTRVSSGDVVKLDGEVQGWEKVELEKMQGGMLMDGKKLQDDGTRQADPQVQSNRIPCHVHGRDGRRMDKMKRVLAEKMKKAPTIEELLHIIYNIDETRFDHVLLSLCWMSLGRLVKRRHAERFWLMSNLETLEPLVQHTLQAASAGALDARGLANVAYGAACVGKLSSLNRILVALAQAMRQRMAELNSQDLANTAWAFATMGQSDAELFGALARMSQKRAGDFKPQELANIAWAFATVGQSDAQLFMKLARAAELCVDDFNAQNIANVAWAFAKTNQPDGQLFAVLARITKQRVDEFNAQNLANTAWAFEKIGWLDEELFQALESAAGRINSNSAGDAHIKTFKAGVEHPRYVRINLLRTTMNSIVTSFEQEGFVLKPTPEKYEDFLKEVQILNKSEFLLDYHMPNFLLVFSSKLRSVPFAKHPLHSAGVFALQDKASCLSIEALNPPPGCTLLDACAAPGMKTSQAANRICQHGQGLVIAIEKDPSRAARMREVIASNCRDLAHDIQVVENDFLQVNPEDYPQVEYMIVDVPCSGSGRAEVIPQVDSSSLAKLTANRPSLQQQHDLQLTILMHALKFPGLKRLVYSTCSVNIEENERVVEDALKIVKDKFEPVHAMPHWTRRGLNGKAWCLRVDPDVDLCTGFFIAVLKRSLRNSVGDSQTKGR